MASDLFSKLVERAGLENISRNSNVARAIRRHGVVKTTAFRQIAALPRREWETDAELPELVERMTAWLKTPGGSMKLWPVQAAALRDIYEQRGLFGPIAVGEGKALISILAPTVLEAVKPVLLVPAQLREQTVLKVLPEMKKHWRVHPKLRVVGYSEVSLAHRADLLYQLKPDALIMDECHYVKNGKSARTRRVVRFLRDHPQTTVVTLSGTVTRKSLRDYWQLLRWSLKEGAPIPERWRELQDWADALDDLPDDVRVAPGALEELCEEGEPVRSGYRRRLVQTPGVVASGEDRLGVGLRIYALNEELPVGVVEIAAEARRTWSDPNGDEFVEAIEMWRFMRQIALGFWYRWQPAAPPEWLEARKGWKQFVREMLKHNRKGLDSELQIWNWCASEGVEDDHPWRAWAAVKDSFKPNPVAQWESEFALDVVEEWFRSVGEGICWVEHRAFGHALEQRGYRYFGEGAKASAEILDASGPIVASIAAHSEGKNLQRWSKNLVTSPPSSGKQWNQLIGRSHRQGQQADEVEVWVLTFLPEQVASFQKAVQEAKYVEETTGVRQRLLYADVDVVLNAD